MKTGFLALFTAKLFAGALLQPVQAQPQTAPQSSTFLGQSFELQKLTRDEAATGFIGFLETLRPPLVSAPPEAGQTNRFINSLSAKSRGQLSDEDVAVLLVLASQWAGATLPAPLQIGVQSESADSATVVAQREVKPQSKPLILVQEAGGWGVDLVATFGAWNNLPAYATIAEVRKSIATNPEFATFSRARDNARRSSCQNNLKQMVMGTYQYMQDHEGKMPPARTWIDAIYPYLKAPQIFNCPAIAQGQKYGYAFNSNASAKQLSVFSSASQTVLIYETSLLQRNAFGSGENRANRHLDGANFAFADGHVKWFAKGETPSFKLKP